MPKYSAGLRPSPNAPVPAQRESAQDPGREKLSPPLCSLEDLHWPRQGEQLLPSLPSPSKGGPERHLAGPRWKSPHETFGGATGAELQRGQQGG